MIHVEDVCKLYTTRYNHVIVLDSVNLHVDQGEFVIIHGPSGSGKTTLLLTISGMLRPTGGRVIIKQNDIYALPEKKRTSFRARHIGFVFQMFHLLPYLNSTENIMLAKGTGAKELQRSAIVQLMNRLHLSQRAYHKPSELSVGECQRIAMARALVSRPDILLADEPTGNLDLENAAQIIEYLKNFHSNSGTVIMATHGNIAQQYTDRIIHLKEGRIVPG